MVVESLNFGNGFEVGDMVWAKMKSQPWWPGHVYSEEFATPLVRRSKREGLLLVAFFGARSFGWFDPSELVPFDSNYAEMCRQTGSRGFVRAVKDAMVEVNRRIGIGMSCMCRNKQNFRTIDVQGFVVVDVAGYDSGAVYSTAAIGKARDGFQPKLALDFLRQVALEPASSEHVDDIDFIKNKATVMSYRKAVFKDFNEAYDLASVQEPAPQETSSKALLSGVEVFADSLGKVKNSAKLEDHAKKDEYLFKRRDDSKEINKEKVVSGPEEVKIPKRPVGELGAGKIITPENKKKQKKEGIFLAEKFSAKKTGQPEGTQRSDDNYEMDLSHVLGDLHSLAVDPCNTVNRGRHYKGKKAFLRFRSLVFQKGKNFALPLADGEPNASKSSEDNVEVLPVKASSGRKRGPSDCQEEVNVSKKKIVGDIRKLTDEKKLINKIDEHPTQDVKQPVATTLKKPGPEPTMLILKFPQGGSLPSFNELKARFARFGPMDHSATQVLRNTFSCQVVFRHKAHAKAAYGFVVGSISLFGNTDVKCSLKDVGDVDAAELLVKVPKDHHQPAIEGRPPPSMLPATSSVQLKSILKTSGGEEAARKGGREVFADSLGKVMNAAKPTNHAKKDGYLFKPRDESKEIKKEEENVTSSLLLVGEFDSGKSIISEKEKQKKEGISLVEKFSTKKTGQPEGPQRIDGNYETDLLRVLDDLHSLAVDPFNTVNRGSRIKCRKAFLRFRSLVYKKGHNFSLPLAGGEPNASKSSEDSVQVPPVKPPSGLKEEMAAAKTKKIGDIKNLTKEKKVTKMIDGPPARVVKQPVATTLKKPGPELIKKTEPQAPGPTMLTMKFPQGGSLPSYNELKAKFARFGPMDHSRTHIFWNTFSCQVVFRHNVHAWAAYRFVVGSSSLFGNTGVKCTLKEVGTVSSAKPEPAIKVSEERHQPDMENRPLSLVSDTSGVQPKSILKKSGGEEAASNGARGRVKFMLGGDESQINRPPVPPRSMQMTPSQVLNRPPSDPLTAPNMDITKQMLSLLTRCNDIVTNVTSILGYSPYHQL